MTIPEGSCSRSRRSVYIAGLLLLCLGVPGATAQDDSDTCVDVTASGLVDDDGFPSESTVYSNVFDNEDGVRGEFVNSKETHFIWYCPTSPEQYTSDFPDADYGDCTGYWVISSYPVGSTFSDDVWYQAGNTDSSRCESSPAQVASDQWNRVVRGNSTSDLEIVVTCEAGGVEDEAGVSDKNVIVILIVVGVGFMACLCCGALICCIRGKNNHEEAVMPPGELGEGSIIGAKAEELKPGLHAHPEVAGQQHPRPEDWAPSYSSGRSAIPQGSRSGPSVRSIGYN